MQIITPDWIDAPKNIAAFTTLRQGGFSTSPYDDGLGEGVGGFNVALHVGDEWQHVQQNRVLLRTFLPSEPVWLTQVHGTAVIDAARVKINAVPEADASFTTESGVVCAIQTADCLPVLFCDTAGQVVANAHAGWRGLADGVLENTVMRMREAGAGEIMAWLGPAIGAEKFEVGEDVLQAFISQDVKAQQAFKPTSAHKYLADIYMLARMRLKNIGINRVYGGNYCTMTNAQNFYSYRRDKMTGRIATVIWIK